MTTMGRGFPWVADRAFGWGLTGRVGCGGGGLHVIGPTHHWSDTPLVRQSMVGLKTEVESEELELSYKNTYKET